MPGRDVVVAGASAGGVQALIAVAESLPGDLEAAIFVVLHTPRGSRTHLPEILNRSGPLRAAIAEDDEPVTSGRIYVAPADHHLLVRDERVRLGRGRLEHGHRPAVDRLFRSAARAYGPRVVGVVLSGSLHDGAAGLAAVKAHGGLAVAQDPAEALYPGMPSSAIEAVGVDHIVPAAAIGPLLARLANE